MTTNVVSMEDYSFISKAAEEARKNEEHTLSVKALGKEVDTPPSFSVCGNITIGNWGWEENSLAPKPSTPSRTKKNLLCTSPLLEQVPPSPIIISSSRRAGARRSLKRQEKRISQEDDKDKSGRSGVEKIAGIKAVGTVGQEGDRDGLPTNCNNKKEEAERNFDMHDGNSEQDCSQSLLKKQSDEDLSPQQGEEENGDAGDVEANRVIEEQLSLEEWGEDDLQVG